jgi:hypothetical protein
MDSMFSSVLHAAAAHIRRSRAICWAMPVTALCVPK